MGWRYKIGPIEAGHYADVIAVSGDPLVEVTKLEHVKFVMKVEPQLSTNSPSIDSALLRTRRPKRKFLQDRDSTTHQNSPHRDC